MFAFYIPWICWCYMQLSQCVSLIELNAWKDEWLVIIKALKKGKKERKRPKEGKRKRSDLVCGQYTNLHKLGAKQGGQEFFKP
jgi:hypothetical protein